VGGREEPAIGGSGLAESFRVVVYDRRGHSRSQRPDTPGSVDEDGEDLAALLEALDLAPAHEEVAFGPGAWGSVLPSEMRAIVVDNAPTFLDELEGPNQLRVDEDALSQLALPVRLTQGSASPAIFPAVIDRLVELIPRVSRETIDGAAHVPQLTMPERYVEVTTHALQRAAA
jgi:pimeloyl-ACP methyl ester carboxylesterase